jgi:hypothetical protein
MTQESSFCWDEYAQFMRKKWGQFPIRYLHWAYDSSRYELINVTDTNNCVLNWRLTVSIHRESNFDRATPSKPNSVRSQTWEELCTVPFWKVFSTAGNVTASASHFVRCWK